MFLNDDTIHKLPLISPYNQDQLQPASYDVRLGRNIQIPRPYILDLRSLRPSKEFMDPYEMGEDESYILRPGDCILGETVETINVPAYLRASIEGKSSLARLWLFPIAEAGYLDPGFSGVVTLEILNLGPFTLMIYPGMLIAQVSFAELNAPAKRPYGSEGLGSHYQNQKGVEGSKYGKLG